MKHDEALKCVEQLGIAISALRKQIGQSPTEDGCCPVCDTEVTYYYCDLNASENLKERVYDDYCTGCGQKIDWSDYAEGVSKC